jgi:hypothetical protein
MMLIAAGIYPAKPSTRGDIMTAFLRTLFAILLLGLIAGCANPGAIAPNVTTADELLKRLGSPTDKRANPACGEFW